MSLLEKICKFNFDKTYCINIQNRKDRRKNVIKQCLKIDLEFEFLSVKKNKEDPVRGCLESHLKCIKNAIDFDYENILIMEDDILFDIEAINKILENNTIQIPKNFDMLYLGYHINNGYQFTDNIIKATSTQTTHCYILNKRVFKYIYENIENEWNSIPEYSERNNLENMINWNVRAIDLFYAKWINHRRNNSFAIYPILCFQYPNHSDIEEKYIDYQELMTEKANIIYNKKNPTEKKQIIDLTNIKKTFMINLDRRNDRWNKMTNLFKKINNLKITRFSAIDGQTFDFSQYLRLFVNVDLDIIKNPYSSHQFQKGVLGCALSHYRLWTIINSDIYEKDDIFLILEDDIDLVESFSNKLQKILNILNNDNLWHITYVGFTDDKDIEGDYQIHEGIKKFSGEKRLNGGGTFAYLIRKSGAEKLIRIADTDGIRQAIDWFMIEQFDKLNCYKCNPELITSLSTFAGNNDSDVQNIKNKINPARIPATTRIIINDQIYYRDNDRNVFKFNLNYSISFVGKLNSDNMTINTNTILDNDKIQINLIPTKPTILIYVGKFSNIMTINLAETLSNVINIIVFCECQNVRINGILYLHYSKFSTCIKQIKPIFIICTDLTFFLSNNPKSHKLIFWQQNPLRKNIWNQIPLPVNGRPLLFNVANMIHKIVCPCKLHKKLLSHTMLIAESSISIIPYCIKNIYKTLYSNKIKNQFICLDHDTDSAIQFFKKFKEKHNNAKLILFNSEVEVFEGLEIITTNNINEIFKILFSCEFFINFDMYDESFYNILVAIKANTLCLTSFCYNLNTNELEHPWILVNDNNVENVFPLLESENKKKLLLKKMEIYINKFDVKNTSQKWIDYFLM